MRKPDEIPRLRSDIEAIATSHEGAPAYVIRDALGLVHPPVLILGPALHWLRLLDGCRSLRDIQLEIMRSQDNHLFEMETLTGFIDQLDQALLLDSENYRSAKELLISEFRDKDVRPAVLAGKAYPAETGELAGYLDNILKGESASPPDRGASKPWALIAPHIDIEIGKRVYGRAYAAIADLAPEKIILIGTGHALGGEYFSVTEKDFDTPFGRVRTDRESAARLKNQGKSVVGPDDFAHKNEHSLEFQLIFLQHLFGSDFLLLPLLCGSFFQNLEGSERAGDIPGVMPVLDFLREILDREPSALVVAGVDFSHIGFKFGHQYPAAEMKTEASGHDHSLIEAVIKGSPRDFWMESRRVRDAYHVCGMSAIACLLELRPGSSGMLLDYEMWDESATQSAVGFAAVTLFQNGESFEGEMLK